MRLLRLLMILMSVLISVLCNAQLQPPVQIDTLIIKSVKYNFTDIYEGNWPYSVIIKSTTSFTFGDRQFRILDAEKGFDDEIYFTLIDGTSGNYDDEYTLVYQKKDEDIRVKFSGYEFGCRPYSVHASFRGGGPNEFSKWVNSQLEYPEEALNKGIQGIVRTRFTVDKDGSVRNVEVVESVDPLLAVEAIRVISSSPKWTPGMKGDEPISISYEFPVIFSL